MPKDVTRKREYLLPDALRSVQGLPSVPELNESVLAVYRKMRVLLSDPKRWTQYALKVQITESRNGKEGVSSFCLLGGLRYSARQDTGAFGGDTVGNYSLMFSVRDNDADNDVDKKCLIVEDAAVSHLEYLLSESFPLSESVPQICDLTEFNDASVRRHEDIIKLLDLAIQVMEGEHCHTGLM